MTANFMSQQSSDPMRDESQSHNNPSDQPEAGDESLENLVRRYTSERRYLGDDGEIIKRKHDDFGDDFEPLEKPKRQPLTIMPVTTDDRIWGSLVYMLPIMTLLLGGLTAGILVPIIMMVSLWLYANNRERSPYVAEHARQALIIEAVGTFGWLAVLIGLPLVGALLTVVLALTLVGIVLIPVLWLMIVLVLIASLLMPLSLLGFGVMGAWQAWQGLPFRYPIRFNRNRRWRGMGRGWRETRNWRGYIQGMDES